MHRSPDFQKNSKNCQPQPDAKEKKSLLFESDSDRKPRGLAFLYTHTKHKQGFSDFRVATGGGDKGSHPSKKISFVQVVESHNWEGGPF